MVDIDEVNADGIYLDEGLIGTGVRLLYLLVNQLVSAAIRLDSDCFQGACVFQSIIAEKKNVTGAIISLEIRVLRFRLASTVEYRTLHVISCVSCVSWDRF